MGEGIISFIVYGAIIVYAIWRAEQKKKLTEKDNKSVETLNIQKVIELEKLNSKKENNESHDQLVDNNDEIESDYVDTLGFNKDDILQEDVHAHDGFAEVEKLILESNDNPIKEYK